MIYRYPQQGIISGVCVGLAKAAGLEVWVVRLLAVLLFLFGGYFVMVIAYVAAALILDKAPDSYYQTDPYQAIFDQTPLKEKTWQAGATANQKLADMEMEFDVLSRRIGQLESYTRSDDFKHAGK
ncbi:phage shock protein C (PspC) family protein [Pasteurella testudinis DSM 23072]|uniref:Phage shock protein C (PspC) family protein n=1 Tax=Pasteurella testudinis DSM 23072 TaxID=1122938 RepID=A0A1W1UUU1_9PAST|nr:envelope stress response membrane protein PspC [Pasteurella testudinis]SMB84842.1 phage shock protein C (PspC) family protein [Pasteurella testudinis DSM 23072]SUB51248.1 Phage shock protein C [Pasteurella testudinis]